MCELNTVREPERQTPVSGLWDVVIIGGGVAGVSAALAAARRGGRVALVEKECGLGGLATLANVLMYLPICDGRGRQVMAGITEELLRCSIADVKVNRPEMGLVRIPDCWSDPTVETPELLAQRKKDRYACSYNPHSVILEMEALLLQAGVAIFYDTRFVGCVQEGDRLSHVLVENKSGRLALAAHAFIDCSGDADLCMAAGCATDDINGNVVCGWYFLLHNDKLRLQAYTRHYSPDFSKEKSTGPFFSGIRGRDVSAQIIETRNDIRANIAKMRDENPEDEVYPVMLPSIPSFRATRRLSGAFTLQDAHKHQWFEDTVGLFGDWRKAGPVWALPLRSLRTAHCRNLYAAGRCISADITVWDVTRVIPVCALSGEAAGAAALHAATVGHDSGQIDVRALQQDLRANRNLIDQALISEQPA